MIQIPSSQDKQERQYDLPYHWFLSPDGWRGRNYFGYLTAAIDAAVRHGVSIETGRILDAGCGDGRLIKLLHEYGAREVFGIDYSEAAVRFSRVFLPETEFVIADFAEKTSLQDIAQSDAIFLIETLEHIELEKVSTVINNLTDLLKPGGVLVITVPSVLLPLQDKHYQHFTSDSLRSYLEPAIPVVEVFGYNSKKKPWLRLLYKLLDNRLWEIKPASRWFNLHIYPKYLNVTEADHGLGLIAVCKKDG